MGCEYHYSRPTIFYFGFAFWGNGKDSFKKPHLLSIRPTQVLFKIKFFKLSAGYNLGLAHLLIFLDHIYKVPVSSVSVQLLHLLMHPLLPNLLLNGPL